MSNLLESVSEQLINQGVVHEKSKTKLVISSPWDDDVEVIFVPVEFHGVKGGTLEVSFVSAEEHEASFHCDDTTPEEVVEFVLECAS